MVPAWSTSWKRPPATWVDFPNSLVDVMKTFENIKDKVSMLRWIEIAREIVDGVNRTDERLDSANMLMSVAELRHYVKKWRTGFPTVDDLIRWTLSGADGPKSLAEFSRPGAYVADFMFTLLAIERGAILPKSHYVVIKNKTYVHIADKLGITNDYYNSANNTGNVMESLFWFAYEQKR